MDQISWADFEKVELRVGTITTVEDFPEARKPAYKLTVDFGEEVGVRRSSAQITELYSKEELLGKQVVGVGEFPIQTGRQVHIAMPGDRFLPPGWGGGVGGAR